MSESHGQNERADLAEPKTPMWLPALGAALFVAAGVAWALMNQGPAAASAGAAAAAGVSDGGPAAIQK